MTRPFPHKLFYLGEVSVLQRPLVAILGSSHPTLYGRQQAFRFAKHISSWATVVPRGAIGIDAIATRAALESGGRCCAVLGSGLEKPSPYSQKELFQRMAMSRSSLLLSQFPPQIGPLRWNSPKRNVTIAAICDFILIVEASQKSGSLLTVRAALDFGVGVGAIPGPVDNLNSEGTNGLIQKGAYSIEHPEELRFFASD